MLVTAGRRSRCSGDCGTPIEAAELVEYRQGERARHIVCPLSDPTGPVTAASRGGGRDNSVTRSGIANGHAPVGRDSGVCHVPVTRDNAVTNGSVRRDSPVSHAPARRDNGVSYEAVTRDSCPIELEKELEEKRGSFASPGDGAGAPSVADQADRLLDEYERTILPTLQRIGDGTFTVELDGPSDYVTFTLDAMRDDPDAQRVLPLADSKHPLSHDGETLFRSFAIVRGRRAMPVRRLLSDASPAVQRPLRRLLLGLEAVLRSSDGALSYGLAYARQAGRCFRCGETLTTPASLSRGIGPKCFKKFAAGE